MKRRIPGSCALSERMVFEVEQARPDGSPLRLGKPLPEARRAQLVLLDGRRMDVTVHADEVATLPQRLPEIHRVACESLAWEHFNRAQTGAAPLNETQQAHATRTLLEIVHNPPIGVIAVEDWADIAKRNARA